MKTFGIALVAAGLLLLIVAWSYNFPGMKETHQRWDSKRGGWVTTSVKDDAAPLRWMFTGIGALTFVAGGVLAGSGWFQQKRRNP
jgi:hypothetical protein